MSWTHVLIAGLSLVFSFFGSVILYYIARIDKKLDTMTATLNEKGEKIAKHDSVIENHESRIKSIEDWQKEISKEHNQTYGGLKCNKYD